MGADEQFRFRYGLSFRGLISNQPLPQVGIVDWLKRAAGFSESTIDFREIIAKPVADDLKRNCGGERKVLYDKYYEAELAGADLDQKLPPLYRLCELVVVFLCNDYAARDWCLDEWAVIQDIARARSSTHRVMFLWHGPMDQDAMEKLDLPRNTEGMPRDGFMHIDGKSWQDISAAIIKRYESNKEMLFRPCAADAPNVSAASWAGDGYRLQLTVEAPPTIENKPLSQRQFLLHSRLLSPEGEGISPDAGEGGKFDHAFDQLAKAIVGLAQSARVIVNSHFRSSARTAARGGAARQSKAKFYNLIVSLALPSEFIISPELYGLLREIRRACQASEDGAKGECVPIVLACAERIMAREQIKSALKPSQSKWMQAAARVQEIGAIVLGDESGEGPLLQDLKWWAFCDGSSEWESQQDANLPRYFLGDPDRVRAGQGLQESPLNPQLEGDDRFSPEALYLSWLKCCPQLEREIYRRRMLSILYSGVPLFLMDRPGLDQAQDRAPAAQGDPQGVTHPFDALLGWPHAKLLAEFCRFHRMTQPPSNKDTAVLWGYLCNSLLFWEDDRCDYVPGSRSPNSTVAVVPFTNPSLIDTP